MKLQQQSFCGYVPRLNSVLVRNLHALLGGILKWVSIWIFSGYPKAKSAFAEALPCAEKSFALGYIPCAKTKTGSI